MRTTDDKLASGIAALKIRFIDDLENRTSPIEAAYASLKSSHPREHAAILARIEGLAHSLKGAASSFGLDDIASASKKIEIWAQIPAISAQALALEAHDDLETALAELISHCELANRVTKGQTGA